MKYFITVEGESFEIEVNPGGRVWVNRRPYRVDFQDVNGLSQYSLLVDNRSYEALIGQAEGEELQMVVAGRSYRTHLQQRECHSVNGDSQPCTPGTGELRAPLPGLLVQMPVEVGQCVMQGEVMAVLESMKMNLELRAPSDGVVQAVHGVPGTEVGQGDVLAVIRPQGLV